MFGGGYVGLMGEVAHAAKLAGANVTGILPEFLRHLEPPSAEEEIIFTTGLPERKKTHAVDGGCVHGSTRRNRNHRRVLRSDDRDPTSRDREPIFLLNTEDFFAPLQMLVEQVVLAGVRRCVGLDILPRCDDAGSGLSQRWENV